MTIRAFPQMGLYHGIIPEKANQEQAINRLDFAIDFIEKQLLAFKTNID